MNVGKKQLPHSYSLTNIFGGLRACYHHVACHEHKDNLHSWNFIFKLRKTFSWTIKDLRVINLDTMSLKSHVY